MSRRIRRKKNKTESCTCWVCRGACMTKPGWFLPSQLESLTKHLGATLREVFNEVLAVDWHEDPNTVFLLAPAVRHVEPGREYPADPRGVCVFYDLDSGECTIHSVKPYECRRGHHTRNHQQNLAVKRHVREQWNNQESQTLIVDLLGRVPEEKLWRDS